MTTKTTSPNVQRVIAKGQIEPLNKMWNGRYSFFSICTLSDSFKKLHGFEIYRSNRSEIYDDLGQMHCASWSHFTKEDRAETGRQMIQGLSCKYIHYDVERERFYYADPDAPDPEPTTDPEQPRNLLFRFMDKLFGKSDN